MITAVDSSVLIDVLEPRRDTDGRATRAFREARTRGAVIIGEVVFAEVFGRYDALDVVQTALRKLGITFTPSDHDVAFTAGRIWNQYLQAGGGRDRVIADFFIGAHAVRFADRLLTRDLGYFRQHFSGLDVLTPA